MNALKCGEMDVKRVMCGGKQVWPDEMKGEIIFEATTTGSATSVPLIVLRSDDRLLYSIDFGDGKSEAFATLDSSNGTVQTGTDTNGDGVLDHFETTFTGNSGAITHMYAEAGTYTVTVRFAGNISSVIFTSGFYEQGGEWISIPLDNPYITRMKKFKSNSLTSLSQTFAGLVKCRHDDDFVLETPAVSSMWAAFFNYGKQVYAADELWELQPALLSQINGTAFSARGLDEAFRGSGFTNIARGFFAGFTSLISLFETFRQMPNLGRNWFSTQIGNDHQIYPIYTLPQLHPSSGPGVPNTDEVLENDRSFIPVDLLWYSPNLTTIEGLFNAIKSDRVDTMWPNGYAYNAPVRRDFFWNGRLAGNLQGTLMNINYVFYKNNYILFETDVFAYIKGSLVTATGLFDETFGSSVLVMAEHGLVNYTNDIVEVWGFTKGSSISYLGEDKYDITAGDSSSGIPSRAYAYAEAEIKAQYPNLSNIARMFGGLNGQPSSLNNYHSYGEHGTSKLDVDAFTKCFDPEVEHTGALGLADGNMLNKANVDDVSWFVLG